MTNISSLGLYGIIGPLRSLPSLIPPFPGSIPEISWELRSEHGVLPSSFYPPPKPSKVNKYEKESIAQGHPVSFMADSQHLNLGLPLHNLTLWSPYCTLAVPPRLILVQSQSFFLFEIWHKFRHNNQFVQCDGHNSYVFSVLLWPLLVCDV